MYRSGGIQMTKSLPWDVDAYSQKSLWVGWVPCLEYLLALIIFLCIDTLLFMITLFYVWFMTSIMIDSVLLHNSWCWSLYSIMPPIDQVDQLWFMTHDDHSPASISLTYSRDFQWLWCDWYSFWLIIIALYYSCRFSNLTLSCFQWGKVLCCMYKKEESFLNGQRFRYGIAKHPTAICR